MSVNDISQNKITEGSRLYYQDWLDGLNTLVNGTYQEGTTSDEDLMQSIIPQVLRYRWTLREESYYSLSSLSGTAKDNYDNLMTSLDAVNTLYDEGNGDVDAIKSFLSTDLQARATAMAAAGTSGLELRPSIQDTVYYEYSRTGEADLNTQLGELGDALDTLNTVTRIINNIDIVLSLNPTETYLNERGELLSTYYSSSVWSNVIGSDNAIQVLQKNLTELQAIQSSFDTSSDTYESIGNIITTLGTTYNVDAWTGHGPQALWPWLPSDNGTSTGAVVTGNSLPPVWSAPAASLERQSFPYLWQDTSLRRNVDNLITTITSQNDVEKQNLRKAMFLYQEFVKSAGSVMDRIFEAGRNIASRIGR